MMQKISVPILLLYGEVDPWIPVEENIARWTKNGPQEVIVRQINDANHFMISIEEAGIYGDSGSIVPAYTDTLTRWLRQRVV